MGVTSMYSQPGGGVAVGVGVPVWVGVSVGVTVGVSGGVGVGVWLTHVVSTHAASYTASPVPPQSAAQSPVDGAAQVLLHWQQSFGPGIGVGVGEATGVSVDVAVGSSA